MQLKGSQTEKNLEAALAGESIARNKYTFYSDNVSAVCKDSKRRGL